MLQSKYEEEEQSKNFTTITFTARIVKKPHPLGFGLLLVEDLKHGGLLIKV